MTSRTTGTGSPVRRMFVAVLPPLSWSPRSATNSTR